MKRLLAASFAAILLIICVFALVGDRRYGRYTLDKDLIHQISSNNSNYVKIENIPDNLKNAIIAAEDTRFYRHHGFDVIGIARALVIDIKSGSFKEGGSTITQQLAKNLFLDNDKTLSRKLEELVLAVKLENLYSKDEILEMYLNVIYFGSGAYGVESASQVYFKKDVQYLSLEECAMLAGLPKAPSLYNPKANYKKALTRQKTILYLMEQHGYIKAPMALANI